MGREEAGGEAGGLSAAPPCLYFSPPTLHIAGAVWTDSIFNIPNDVITCRSQSQKLLFCKSSIAGGAIRQLFKSVVLNHSRKKRRDGRLCHFSAKPPTPLSTKLVYSSLPSIIKSRSLTLRISAAFRRLLQTSISAIEGSESPDG